MCLETRTTESLARKTIMWPSVRLMKELCIPLGFPVWTCSSWAASKLDLKKRYRPFRSLPLSNELAFCWRSHYTNVIAFANLIFHWEKEESLNVWEALSARNIKMPIRVQRAWVFVFEMIYFPSFYLFCFCFSIEYCLDDLISVFLQNMITKCQFELKRKEKKLIWFLLSRSFLFLLFRLTVAATKLLGFSSRNRIMIMKSASLWNRTRPSAPVQNQQKLISAQK